MWFFGKSKKKLRQEISELKDEVGKLYKLQFREGDKVYINDGHRDPRKVYYLCRSYNNGHCYYISDREDSKGKYIGQEVHIKDISHEPPKECGCCHRLIEDEKNEK